MPEKVWTVAITTDDSDRYLPPTWKVIASEARLPKRIRDLEIREDIRVTRVINEQGREIAEPIWRI